MRHHCSRQASLARHGRARHACSRDTKFSHWRNVIVRRDAQKDAAGHDRQFARDVATDRCHYPTINKSCARRTKRGCRGGNKSVSVGARVPFGPTRPLASHGTTDCPSSADFVPRLARGSLPLLLPAAGGAGRSGDDHRRSRRQGRDHRRHPPGTRSRPIDPGPVLRIHHARAARRSRPLHHLQQDGERGTRDDHRPDGRADAGRDADRRAERPCARNAGCRQSRPHHRSHHHGVLGGGRVDAGVLHRPDPDPVRRIQMGAVAVHRPHRAGMGRRTAEPDPPRADARARC